MRISVLFAGIFATFAFAWFGQTLLPQAQLGGLQPQTDEDGGDIYPVNNPGVVARGRKVYVSEGCYYCHTQLVRGEEAGSDIDRGWGDRRTVARDYIFDNPPVLGVSRNGPDLANTGDPNRVNPAWKYDENSGKLWKPASWLYAHLYNPRETAPHSIMPSYRYLFETRKIASQRSMDALDLEGADAPAAGYEVVPTREAQDLVGYLLSLDRSHPLKGVQQEGPRQMNPPENPRQTPGSLNIDYRETPNVTHVHAAIQREKRDPLSGSVPIPLWLMGLFFLIFGWGTYYLGEFNGGYSGDVFNPLAGPGSSRRGGAAGGQAEAPPETPVERGKKVFLQNCATCHQPTGLGVPNQYPPLAGSEFVNGGSRRVCMILLKGLQGPLTVEGKNFNGQMPTWATLTDQKIADVLTYVRQEWGNKGAPIYEEQVTKAREEFKPRSEPWAPADILAVPANTEQEGAPAEAAPGAAPASGTGTAPAPPAPPK